MTAVEIDLKLLLDCIKCQLDCPEALTQAALTIANICNSNSETREYLRQGGGLHYMSKLLTSDSQPSAVQDSLMYSLACMVESNIYSQQELSENNLFFYLHSCLAAPHALNKRLQTAIFLVTCLVSNNAKGQNMVRKSGCLQKLIQFFSTLFPVNTSKPADLSLWFTVTSALNVCVNNPQNDENQRLGISILPQALCMLQDRREVDITRAISLLIGLLCAQNVHNQGRVRQCGGIKALMSTLHWSVNRISEDPHYITSAVATCSALNNIMADNEPNVDEVGDLGGVALFLRLLNTADLDTCSSLQVVLALAHCVESEGSYGQQVMDGDGMSCLIRLLSSSTCDELTSAVKYVLQTCVKSKDQRQDHHKQIIDDTISRKLELIERKLTDRFSDPPSSTKLNSSVLEHENKLNHTPIDSLGLPSVVDNWQDLYASFGASHPLNENRDRIESGSKCLPVHQPSGNQMKPKRSLHQRKSGCLERHCEDKTRDVNAHGTAPSKRNCDREITILSIADSGSETGSERSKNFKASHKNLKKLTSKPAPVLSQGAKITPGGKQTLHDFIGQDEGMDSSGNGNNEHINVAIKTLEKEKAARQQLEVDLIDAKNTVRQLQEADEQEARSEALVMEVQRQSDEHIQEKEMNNAPTQHADLFHKQKVLELEFQEVKSQIAELKKETHENDTKCDDYITELDDSLDRLDGIESESVDTDRNLIHENPQIRSTPIRTVAPKTTSKVIVNGKNLTRTPVRMARTLSSSPKVNTESNTFKVPATPVKRKHILTVKSNTLASPCLLQKPTNKLLKSTHKLVFAANQRCDTSRVSTPKCYQHLPASPCFSEFDLELVQHARPSRDGPHRSCSSDKGLIRRRQDKTDKIKIYIDSPGQSLTPAPLMKSASKLFSLCPGCNPPAKLDISPLNSLNYNIALETCPNTCPQHKEVRCIERAVIYHLKQSTRSVKAGRRPLEALNFIRTGSIQDCSKADIYELSCSSDAEEIKRVTPPGSPISSHHSRGSCSVFSTRSTNRRPRVPYSTQEETNLMKGVAKLGKFWTEILNMYKFHPSRTAVDLKDKYKRMKIAENKSTSDIKSNPHKGSRSFSMVEQRRLKRGVRMFGFNWKVILSAFTFSKHRSATELREKWRSLHKVPNFSS